MNEEEKKKFFEISKRIGYKVGTYCNDEEIEVFEKYLEDYKYKNNLIEKQQAEIENWKTEYNHWCQLAIDRKIEIEKKDKIIDLLATAICYEPLPIDEFCIYRNFDCPVVGGNRDCKDCIKKYFNKKIQKGE